MPKKSQLNEYSVRSEFRSSYIIMENIMAMEASFRWGSKRHKKISGK
jgi:hypothetical protein